MQRENEKRRLHWIPLWIDKWLDGSTAQELTLAEQGVFARILCFAARDGGHIRANLDTPYTMKRLANKLDVPRTTLIRTIEKCVKHDKLTCLPSGCLYVTHWDKYQLQESDESRTIERSVSGTSGKATYKRKKEKRRKEHKENAQAASTGAACEEGGASLQPASSDEVKKASQRTQRPILRSLKNLSAIPERAIEHILRLDDRIRESLSQIKTDYL